MAVAIALLPSCSKDGEWRETSSTGKDKIVFVNDGVLSLTKSFVETDVGIISNRGFICAAVVDGDNSTMFNTHLTNDGSNHFIVKDQTYYYPESGTMSFYAVYPITQSISISGGAATLEYGHNGETDLVAACRKNVSKSGSPVSMSFGHILSQVSIQCKGEDTEADYKLKGIQISAPLSAKFQYSDTTWRNEASGDAIPFYSGSAMSIATSSFTDVGSPMSFIPCNAKIKVQWECYNKGTSRKTGSYDQEVYTSLTMGHHVTLKLKLPNSSSEKIYLSMTVENWVNDSQELDVGKVLKTFTVDNDSSSGVNEFRFEEGMTWREFMESPYNTAGTIIFGSYQGEVIMSKYIGILASPKGGPVRPDDVIVEREYRHFSQPSGWDFHNLFRLSGPLKPFYCS